MSIIGKIVIFSSRNQVVSTWLNASGYIANGLTKNKYVTGGLRTAYEMAEAVGPGTSVSIDTSGIFFAQYKTRPGVKESIALNPSLAKYLVDRNITGFEVRENITGYELFKALKTESAIAEKLDLSLGASSLMRMMIDKNYESGLKSKSLEAISCISTVFLFGALSLLGVTSIVFMNYFLPTFTVFAMHEVLKASLALKHGFHISNVTIGVGGPLLSFSIKNTRIDINSIPLLMFVDVPPFYQPKNLAYLKPDQLVLLNRLGKIMLLLGAPAMFLGCAALYLYQEVYNSSSDYDFLWWFCQISFISFFLQMLPSKTLLTDTYACQQMKKK